MEQREPDTQNRATQATEGESVEAAESFEGAMSRLEAVVERLEGGDLELEAALTSFEEGVRLSRSCAEQLGAAEQRVALLTREGGEWTEQPFDVDDEDEAR